MHRSLIYLRAVFICLLIILTTYQVSDHIKYSKLLTKVEYDLAAVNSIRFGLLDIGVWKRKLFRRVESEIASISLDFQNTQFIQDKIETILYRLIDEVESDLTLGSSRTNSFVEDLFKNVVAPAAIQLLDLRTAVPRIAKSITSSIQESVDEEQLKNLILEKLAPYFDHSLNPEQVKLEAALNKMYGCSDLQSCRIELNTQRSNLTKEYLFVKFTTYALLCIVVVLMVFIVPHSNSEKIGGLVLLGLLLYAGVSLPMLAVSASLESLSFNLFGGEVGFDHQILFARIKSITDVILGLLTSASVESKFIGLMVIGFSFLFPISKIILLTFWSFTSSGRDLPWVVSLGKWSMADVFVAAIVVAVVGLDSMIGSQLDRLDSASNGFVDIVSMSSTEFGIGAIFFTAYCLASSGFAMNLRKVSLNS